MSLSDHLSFNHIFSLLWCLQNTVHNQKKYIYIEIPRQYLVHNWLQPWIPCLFIYTHPSLLVSSATLWNFRTSSARLLSGQDAAHHSPLLCTLWSNWFVLSSLLEHHPCRPQCHTAPARAHENHQFSRGPWGRSNEVAQWDPPLHSFRMMGGRV